MAEDYSDLVEAARRGQLAQDDQRLQRLERHARQGVSAAEDALRQINEAGGAHRGSVNRVI
jgi:hypothetical protein